MFILSTLFTFFLFSSPVFAMVHDAPDKDASYITASVNPWIGLYNYVTQGNLAALEKLFKEGQNIHQCDCYSHTTLHEAVFNGHVAIVIFLLENGAEVNAVNDEECTALHLASKNPDVVNRLLHFKADLEALNLRNQTPLMCALEAKNAGVIYALLKAGASCTGARKVLRSLEPRIEFEEKFLSIITNVEAITDVTRNNWGSRLSRFIGFHNDLWCIIFDYLYQRDVIQSP